MALPAGVPPASFRLEGGCLMCSATTAIQIGQRGRICTCGHPVPSRACCCYTTRCSPRCAWGHTGDFVSWGLRDPHTLNPCPAVRYENWRTRRELQQAVPAPNMEKRTSWHCARAEAPPLIEL